MNGEVSTDTNAMTLPVPQLPKEDIKVNTFANCLHSLMSVGKTSDTRPISIITKYRVTVQKGDGMMTTCKGKPIIIGARGMHGRK